MTFDALLREALSLPTEQRAVLLKELSESFASEEVERAWANEVRARVEELRSGRGTTVPAAQVIGEIREALRARRA